MNLIKSQVSSDEFSIYYVPDTYENKTMVLAPKELSVAGKKIYKQVLSMQCKEGSSRGGPKRLWGPHEQDSKPTCLGKERLLKLVQTKAGSGDIKYTWRVRPKSIEKESRMSC